MKNVDRYNRGSYLLRDAVFVKDSVIPLALESKHWNIVVFESYRVSELLIKSMLLLSGQTPESDHALEPLIDQLCTIGDAEIGLPFNYRIYGRNGDFHGIMANRKNIKFIKYSGNNFTELGSTDLGSPTVENILALQLVIDEYSIKIKLSEKELFSSTDPVRHPKKIVRSIIRSPNYRRIDSLKNLTLKLREQREPAFYSEKFFKENEAQNAVDRLSQIFHLCTDFVVADYE